MPQHVRRFPGFIPVIALATILGAASAQAQELQLDPHAFDAPATSKPAGKKAKGAVAPSNPAVSTQQQGGKPRPDRQFGELEGWSPGKEPPKPKDAPNTGSSGSSNSMPVKMSPGGNMGTGFTF